MTSQSQSPEDSAKSIWQPMAASGASFHTVGEYGEQLEGHPRDTLQETSHLQRSMKLLSQDLGDGGKRGSAILLKRKKKKKQKKTKLAWQWAGLTSWFTRLLLHLLWRPRTNTRCFCFTTRKIPFNLVSFMVFCFHFCFSCEGIIQWLNWKQERPYY